jgi:hypothetical protein
VWLRRRIRYVPDPLTGPDRTDPDLAPLPPILTRLRQLLRVQAPTLLDPPPRPPTVAEAAARPVPPPLPPIGPSGPDLAGLGAIPPDGLSLTGPRTHDAARALLVATLSSGSAHDPDARGHVVIPAATLTELLGASAVDVGAIPRLTVTPHLADAITHLDQLVISRRRLLDEEDAADLPSMRATNPYHPPIPPVLLITDPPDPGLAARQSTTINLGAPLQITTVVLGDWPPGGTRHVDGDGTSPPAPTTARRSGYQCSTPPQRWNCCRSSARPTPDNEPPRRRSRRTPTVQPGAIRRTTARRTRRRRTGRPPGRPNARTPIPTALPLLRRRPRRWSPFACSADPCVLTSDGRVVPGLRTSAAELIVYLAVHRHGADLSDVMEALFPDATRRRAGERLATEVANLRNRIRHAAGNPDPSHRIAALRRAVAAYTGPLAARRDFDWIESAREHSRRQGVVLHTQLAGLVGDTNPTEAARLLEAACELDPSNEELVRDTTRAHARTGDAAAIRAQLQHLRGTLDELDIAPDDETSDLATELLRDITRTPRNPRANPTAQGHN